MPQSMKRTSALLALALLLGLSPAARAGGTATTQRARNFFTQDSNARKALGYLHFGCTLKGVQCLEEYTQVKDGAGTVLVGWTGVKIRYRWSGLDNGNDYSDVSYFFDGAGKYRAFRTNATTATVFRPFVSANLVIDVLREAIRDAVRNNENATFRATVEGLARSADAAKLFQLWLEIAQP